MVLLPSRVTRLLYNPPDNTLELNQTLFISTTQPFSSKHKPPPPTQKIENFFPDQPSSDLNFPRPPNINPLRKKNWLEPSVLKRGFCTQNFFHQATIQCTEASTMVLQQISTPSLFHNQHPQSASTNLPTSITPWNPPDTRRCRQCRIVTYYSQHVRNILYSRVAAAAA